MKKLLVLLSVGFLVQTVSAQKAFNFKAFWKGHAAEMIENYRAEAMSDIVKDPTKYALIDIDQDGTPEIWLRNDNNEDGAIFTIGGDEITLVCAEDFKFHISVSDGAVMTSGGAGTGAFYSAITLIEDSKMGKRIEKMDEYNIETEEMDSGYSIDGDDVSESEGKPYFDRFTAQDFSKIKWTKLPKTK